MTKVYALQRERILKHTVIFTVMLSLLLAFFQPFTAKAAGGIELSTAYPGIMVKAGEAVSVNLDLENTSGSSFDASLSAVSMPEGWEGYFSGGGKQISKVHAANGETVTGVTFQLTIPKDAAEGTYQVQLNAAADSGISDTAGLEFTISENEYGQSSFTTEYPSQEGPSGTTFTFNTTLVNNGADTQSYSLSAQAPSGWQVSFKPSGESTQIAAIDIDSAGTQGIGVTVVPPANVEAGEYAIPITAVSSKETMNLDLNVKITETYGLEVTTPTGLLSMDTSAGKDSAVTLNVINHSNVTLENISLTSSAPAGWTVEFDNSTIESLDPGATKEVVAHITPSEDAMTGDYVTSISASVAETSGSAEFRVTVKTATIWGIVAIGIIAALIAGLGYVFKKYGRR